jgi:hypothetical protein
MAESVRITGNKDEVWFARSVFFSTFFYLGCSREMNESVDPILLRSLIGTSRLRGIPFGRSSHVKYQYHVRTLFECLGLGKSRLYDLLIAQTIFLDLQNEIN